MTLAAATLSLSAPGCVVAAGTVVRFCAARDRQQFGRLRKSFRGGRRMRPMTERRSAPSPTIGVWAQLDLQSASRPKSSSATCLDRAHPFGGVRHISRCPQRRLVDRLHVHIGAIEHRETGVVPLEREEEIGAAEQNDLGALLSA